MRHGKAFWRAYHEACGRNELNQREYCEAHWIPLKAFGGGVLKGESQSLERKLLNCRRGLRSRPIVTTEVSQGGQAPDPAGGSAAGARFSEDSRARSVPLGQELRRVFVAVEITDAMANHRHTVLSAPTRSALAAQSCIGEWL